MQTKENECCNPTKKVFSRANKCSRRRFNRKAAENLQPVQPGLIQVKLVPRLMIGKEKAQSRSCNEDAKWLRHRNHRHGKGRPKQNRQNSTPSRRLTATLVVAKGLVCVCDNVVSDDAVSGSCLCARGTMLML